MLITKEMIEDKMAEARLNFEITISSGVLTEKKVEAQHNISFIISKVADALCLIEQPADPVWELGAKEIISITLHAMLEDNPEIKDYNLKNLNNLLIIESNLFLDSSYTHLKDFFKNKSQKLKNLINFYLNMPNKTRAGYFQIVKNKLSCVIFSISKKPSVF